MILICHQPTWPPPKSFQPFRHSWETFPIPTEYNSFQNSLIIHFTKQKLSHSILLKTTLMNIMARHLTIQITLLFKIINPNLFLTVQNLFIISCKADPLLTMAILAYGNPCLWSPKSYHTTILLIWKNFYKLWNRIQSCTKSSLDSYSFIKLALIINSILELIHSINKNTEQEILIITINHLSFNIFSFHITISQNVPIIPQRFIFNIHEQFTI
jgi:hypothetical protein